MQKVTVENFFFHLKRENEVKQVLSTNCTIFFSSFDNRALQFCASQSKTIERQRRHPQDAAFD